MLLNLKVSIRIIKTLFIHFNPEKLRLYCLRRRRESCAIKITFENQCSNTINKDEN
jgi:hypothetical protein